MRIITNVVGVMYIKDHETRYGVVLRNSSREFDIAIEENDIELRKLGLEPIFVGDILEVYIDEGKEPASHDAAESDVLAVVRDGKVLINRGLPELGPPGSDVPPAQGTQLELEF